jgi:hypothetical protein
MISELAHYHTCPADGCGFTRICTSMHCAGPLYFSLPCWPCVVAGRATWPPVAPA